MKRAFVDLSVGIPLAIGLVLVAGLVLELGEVVVNITSKLADIDPNLIILIIIFCGTILATIWCEIKREV